MRWGLCVAIVVAASAAYADDTSTKQLRFVDAVHIQVAPKTASGGKWDNRGNELPDPIVKVYANGTLIDTCNRLNQTEIKCRVRKDVRLDGKVGLKVVIKDRDVLTHEDVGTATLLAFPASSAGKIPLKTTGQVTSAWLAVTPWRAPGQVDPPPPADKSIKHDDGEGGTVDNWGTRLLGLLGGGLVGLALVFGGRSYFLTDAEPMGLVKVRCPNCSALSPEDADTCGDCGTQLKASAGHG